MLSGAGPLWYRAGAAAPGRRRVTLAVINPSPPESLVVDAERPQRPGGCQCARPVMVSPLSLKAAVAAHRWIIRRRRRAPPPPAAFEEDEKNLGDLKPEVTYVFLEASTSSYTWPYPGTPPDYCGGVEITNRRRIPSGPLWRFKAICCSAPIYSTRFVVCLKRQQVHANWIKL